MRKHSVWDPGCRPSCVCLFRGMKILAHYRVWRYLPVRYVDDPTPGRGNGQFEALAMINGAEPMQRINMESMFPADTSCDVIIQTVVQHTSMALEVRIPEKKKKVRDCQRGGMGNELSL